MAFLFHFPTIWLVALKKPWNLIGYVEKEAKIDWKGCNLELDIAQFVNKLHCWEPITLQGLLET